MQKEKQALVDQYTSSTHGDELHRAIMGKHKQQTDKLEILPYGEFALTKRSFSEDIWYFRYLRPTTALNQQFQKNLIAA